MNKKIDEDDIVAARIKAAEGDVPWAAQRGQLARDALAKALKKRKRRRILLSAAVALLVLLALAAWLVLR